MKKDQIVRALRDPEYRASLSSDQVAELSGFGEFNMADETLASLTGGCGFTLCNTCNFGSTPDFSCVPPGSHCP